MVIWEDEKHTKILKEIEPNDIINGTLTIPNGVEIISSSLLLNCHDLRKVVFPDTLKKIESSAFEGCTNLEEIVSSENCKVHISKKSFKNCRRLKEIPSCIKDFPELAFSNCSSLKKIKFNDYTDIEIGRACFRGCTSLEEVINSDNITKMESFAFSGCKSLKRIVLSSSLHKIAAEAFSNCTSLEEVVLEPFVGEIDTRAFYNCPKLREIDLPRYLRHIGKEAFKYCDSIEEITIPPYLDELGILAFSYMDSLKRINVHYANKNLTTPDHKVLIDKRRQSIVLYANGCEDESYSVSDLCYRIEGDDKEIIDPIYSIDKYAFAGSKKLKELSLPTVCKDIEYSAFVDCDNLKTLRVDAIPLFSMSSVIIRENYLAPYSIDGKTGYFPFEILEYDGYLPDLKDQEGNNLTSKYHQPFIISGFPNLDECANGIREIHFNGNWRLNGNFKYFKNLQKVYIDEVGSFKASDFPDDVEFIFANGLSGRNLYTVSLHIPEYRYMLYAYNDGTFIIEKDGAFKTTSIADIGKNCIYRPDAIVSEPGIYLDFIEDLKKHNFERDYLKDGRLMRMMGPNGRKKLFELVNPDDKYFEWVLTNSKILGIWYKEVWYKDNDEQEEQQMSNDDLKKLVKLGTSYNVNSEHHSLLNDQFELFIEFVNLLKENNIRYEELCDYHFLSEMGIDKYRELLKIDKDLLLRILKESELLKSKELHRALAHSDSLNPAITSFVKTIKENNLKDAFLYKPIFISEANNPLLKKMFSVYDANLKRAIKASRIFEKDDNNRVNLNDLLNLFYVTGALESDPITRQKATTFLTEKIFTSYYPNGKSNPNQVIGDDIHRIFNFRNLRDEYDPEFAQFFFENYQELIQREKNSSGFIERIYDNFNDIKRTSTSDRGDQRQLKVTMQKCINFFTKNKFKGVEPKYQDLANLISEWYDNDQDWQNAKKTYEEALLAPRNIFVQHYIREDGKEIWNNDPKNDLKEKKSEGFSYEWLPKQDYDNLILGKYCNCCAHVNGAGNGIMRASMILDCCQNLVIRDELGKIIAKSTIYVNRDEGYAVFNNVEMALSRRNNTDKLKIYEAFLRGSKAFLDKYNANNQDSPLRVITIGTNRNAILEQLKSHQKVKVKKALEYGDYSLYTYHYNGDWHDEQLLVIEKEDDSISTTSQSKEVPSCLKLTKTTK